MASARPRRRSVDEPPDFSHLSQHAASFIKLHTSSEPTMIQIVEELQGITAKQKKKQRKVKKGRSAGIVSAGVVAGLGLVAAPFTAGLSLVVVGVAETVSIAVGFAVKEASGKHVKTVQKLVDDLLQVVAPLKSELEEIKKLCEALQREATAGSDAEHIIRLETHLETLLDAVAPLQTPVTADCVTDVADQCEQVVDEFGNMKTQLKAFRETTDTENTPTDSVNV